MSFRGSSATDKSAKNLTPRPLPACTAVDLFCGAGGFSLGAMRAGFSIALAVDIDPTACATYSANLSQASHIDNVVQADISNLDPAILRQALTKMPRGCDLMIGGPPCQGFSTHRLNNRGVDDPRNGLLLSYFSVVSIIRPRYFLIENVQGILWPRHAAWLDALYSLAETSGYKLDEPKILNAADYGVPQRRKRVFILGRRADQAKLQFPVATTHCDPRRSAIESLPPWETSGPSFRPTNFDDPNNVHMQHNRDLIAAFRRTPPNGGSRRDSGRTLPCHSSHDGHSDVYGRIDPMAVAPTMTSACINPSKGRFVHPTEHHGITVRQAARLQTFPDSYIFSGGLMASGRLIGNAVPPLLAERLLADLAKQLRP